MQKAIFSLGDEQTADSQECKRVDHKLNTSFCGSVRAHLTSSDFNLQQILKDILSELKGSQTTTLSKRHENNGSSNQEVLKKKLKKLGGFYKLLYIE